MEVPVTNTGPRAGSEVVQLYVGAQAPLVKRPVKELAGFAKVELQPGDVARVRIGLGERAFSRWDVASRTWVVDAGGYDIHVAASAVDVREQLTWTIDGQP